MEGLPTTEEARLNSDKVSYFHSEILLLFMYCGLDLVWTL